jgi:uncharacterized membrane protein YjgN (DUF898 family)
MRELEEDSTKTALFGAPPPRSTPPSPVFSEALRFTGTGSEYFRIWVVHALLMLLTLGVYSAWAKVRKMRYFAQNTQLMGDGFDYHAKPLRILVGRVLGLALLIAYGMGFEWSIQAGLLAYGLVLLTGPALFASAQRFRLRNTSWRGLRFEFDAPLREVYRVCFPLLLVWLGIAALDPLGFKGSWVTWAQFSTLLLLPMMHARLKRLQHQRASFANQTFSFQPAGWQFLAVYGKAFALAVLIAVALTASIFGLASVLSMWHLIYADDDFGNTQALWVFWMVLFMTLAITWPYFAARIQQVVWGHTQCGPLRFAGEMKAKVLWKLVLGQGALVLLTAGLYWPFAAVAIARYRIESIVVLADSPLPDLLATAALPAVSATTGDGAADLFGLDIGW